MSDTQILPNPPTSILKAVHIEMKALFARYNAMGPEQKRAKRGVFHEIEEKLHIHMEIEEILFYPAVQSMKVELAINVVLKALLAHRQVKGLLVDLRELSLGHQPLDVKMSELQERVLSHLRAEETEIFPHARVLPLETLRVLTIEMENLQDSLLEKRRREEDSPEEQQPF